VNDDLEQRLAALRPAMLPPALRSQLASAEPARRRLHWLHAAVPLAAAAVCIFFAMLDRPGGPAAASAVAAQPADFRVFLPIAQESTLLGVEELAVIEPQPAQPIRLVRARWLDDITYRGDDGHSTLRRQESRAEIIPISLEVF
jgi:hypothetical protein